MGYMDRLFLFKIYTMSSMQLYTWGPALNVPSIDPKCLAIESYLKLIKQKYSVVKCNNPQQSPTGKRNTKHETMYLTPFF
jgi:hypothetical protein